jgi:uncharacterized protein YkwD
MLASLGATRAAGVAALAAMLVLAAPASASFLRRASNRSGENGAPTGVTSAGSQHRRPHGGHAARVCLNAKTPAVSVSRQAMRIAVLCLVNEQRAAHGLPPLRDSAQLTRSAQGWSDEMVASGMFSHGRISRGGSATRGTPGPRWARTSRLASQHRARSSRAWMADARHCHNILNPSYRDLGVGINGHPVAGAASGPATWTQDFGLSIFQTPAAHDWRLANGCPYG